MVSSTWIPRIVENEKFLPALALCPDDFPQILRHDLPGRLQRAVHPDGRLASKPYLRSVGRPRRRRQQNVLAEMDVQVQDARVSPMKISLTLALLTSIKELHDEEDELLGSGPDHDVVSTDGHPVVALMELGDSLTKVFRAFEE